MPSYVYWLSLEFWTLTEAILLICGETPAPQREDERRTSEHHAVEQLLRAKVQIIKVLGPPHFSVLADDRQPPRMTDGMRSAKVMQMLRAEKPLVWGSDLIEAAGPKREKGEAQRQRERSMRLYLKKTPAKVWEKFTSRKQWLAALQKFDPTYFSISQDTFDRFWKDRAQDLSDRTLLKDNAA